MKKDDSGVIPWLSSGTMVITPGDSFYSNSTTLSIGTATGTSLDDIFGWHQVAVIEPMPTFDPMPAGATTEEKLMATDPDIAAAMKRMILAFGGMKAKTQEAQQALLAFREATAKLDVKKLPGEHADHHRVPSTRTSRAFSFDDEDGK